MQSRAWNRARSMLGAISQQRELAVVQCALRTCVRGEGAQGCGEAHLRLTKGGGARPGLVVPRSELTPGNGGAAQEFAGVILVLPSW